MAETQPTTAIGKAFHDAYDGKIGWKLVVQACNGQITAVRQWSVWIRETKASDWQRLHSDAEDLAFEICATQEANCSSESLANAEPVFVDGGAIRFAGGYLKISDPGLKASAATVDIKLDDYSHSKMVEKPSIQWPLMELIQTEYLSRRGVHTSDQSENNATAHSLSSGATLGALISYLHDLFTFITASQNIGVTVDFETINDHAFQPLFCFDQGDIQDKQSGEAQPLGHVLLGEELDQAVDDVGLSRRVQWRISGATERSRWYKVGGRSLEHRIEVSQDIEWKDEHIKDPENAYFEYFVDGVSVQDRSLELLLADGEEVSAPLHGFSNGPLTYLVGYKPAGVPHFVLDKANVESALFCGKIRHLEFDPNSHCGNCPT